MKVWIVVEQWRLGMSWITNVKDDISLYFNESDARKYAELFKDSVDKGNLIIEIQEKEIHGKS